MNSNKRVPSFRNSNELDLDYSDQKLKNFQQYAKYNKATSNVVHDILLQQDLSRAGILFSLNCHLILDEFPVTVEILKSIIDSKSYAGNLNQQSIVEIVLTKCISALRETKMISSYYDDLLELIEICLKYNLNNQNSDSESNLNSYRSSLGASSRYDAGNPYTIVNTPHANIVSDILSCILLDYLDEDLSIKAIPVCIKILHHHNAKRELVREIVSYLNLIACRSPELLIDYVYYLVSGMLKGYQGLASLLYQICENQIECIYPLVKHLIKGLKLIESVNDFNYVLQVMYLVSLSHVQLTIVYLDELIAFLPDTNCQEYVLDIIYSVANQTPIALEPYLKLFDNRLYYDSYKVEKIISTIGKSIKKHSEYCTELLVKRIKYLMSKYKKEVGIKKRYSLVLNEKPSHLFEAEEDQEELIEDIEEEDVVDMDSLDFDTSQNQSSFDYSTSTNPYQRANSRANKKRRSKVQNNNTNSHNHNATKLSKLRTSTSFTYSSRNDQFREKLNLIAANSRILTKRFVQLLTEIYEIAQVFPYVLNPYLGEMEHLFKRHPTSCDSITYLIERLKEIQLENSPKMSSREDGLNELDDLSTTNEEQSSIEDDRLPKKSETDRSETSKSSENSSSQTNASQRSNLLVHHNQEEYDEDEPELVALSNNLAIKEPRLAQPDDDSEFEMDQELQQQTECECETSNLMTSSSFANNLNKQIVKSDHPISSTMRIPNSNPNSQNEPTMNLSPTQATANRDVVERFCTKHAEKIQNYVKDLNRVLPIPDFILTEVNPTDILNKSYVNSNSLCKKFKPRKTIFILKFYCAKKSPNCCLFDKNHFEITTAYPALWIHIIFLAIQAKSNRVLNQQDKELIDLKLVYDKLNEKLPFVALVTSSFPQDKQINELLKELNESRIFDLFECNYTENNQWLCYLCSNPGKACDLSEDNRPLIQGQLKEKHGKWKFLRRWHKRMFTLTGGSIVYFKKDMRQESLNVRYIRSIQTISSSSKEGKNVPKVFEIFTHTNSFLLKAENSSDAAQWLQFLQLSKALENTRIQNSNNTTTTVNENQYSTLLMNNTLSNKPDL